MTRKAIPVEDLTEEEIALIAAAEVDTDEPYDLADLDENGKVIMHRVRGNFYTHSGAPNGEELRLGALLSNEIDSALRERGWTPDVAAVETGLAEQDIRAMRNGNLRRFHAGHLMDALTKFGCDITVVVHPPEEKGGVIHVQGIDDD